MKIETFMSHLSLLITNIVDITPPTPCCDNYVAIYVDIFTFCNKIKICNKIVMEIYKKRESSISTTNFLDMNNALYEGGRCGI